jgi:hypothetical protein
MLVYYEVQPGTALSHGRPHEQMGHVMKGSAELSTASVGVGFEPKEG